MSYYVYHISDSPRLDTGYIGVTKNPQKRWAQHTKSSYRIGSHIRAHGWSFETNFRILLESDKKTCFTVEAALRPKPMGLNETAGGLGGEIDGLAERWKQERKGSGNPNFGKTRSEESKARLSQGLKKYYQSGRYTEEKRTYHSKVLSESGAQAIRKTHWWTNGIDDVRAVLAPSSDWKLGRTHFNPTNRYTTEERARLDPKTKPVIVDGIEYFSIAEAVRRTGKCKQTLRKILNQGTK